MALPTSGAIDLDQIYAEAVFGGYSGGKDLASLAIWNGWSSGPDGILPHEMTEFYGASALVAANPVGSSFELAPNSVFSLQLYKMSDDKVLLTTSILRGSYLLNINLSTETISLSSSSSDFSGNITKIDSQYVLAVEPSGSAGSIELFHIDLSTGAFLYRTAYNPPGWLASASAVLLDGNNVILFHWAGNGNRGDCRLLSVDTNSASITPIGDVFTFNTDDGASLNEAIKIDNSHVLNVWFDLSDSRTYCQLFEVNTDTGFINSLNVRFQLDNNIRDFSVFLLNNDLVISFYRNQAGEGFVQCFQIDVNTGVINVKGTKLMISSSLASLSNGTILSYKVTGNRFACVWGVTGPNRGGFFQLFQYNPVTENITIASDQVKFEDDGTYAVGAVLIDSNHSLVSWVQDFNRRGLCQIINHSI